MSYKESKSLGSGSSQAVNTIVRRGDQLIGENTDGKGFVKALQEVVNPHAQKFIDVLKTVASERKG